MHRSWLIPGALLTSLLPAPTGQWSEAGATTAVSTASASVASVSLGYDSVTGAITASNHHANASMIYIAEGSTVHFRGRYVSATGTWEPLRTTDSYVQIRDPASVPGADPCGLTDDDLDHRFDATDGNELTGPMRRAVSGIYALGPEESGEGYVEPAPGAACCSLTVPAAAPAGSQFQEVRSVNDPAGVRHALCRLMEPDSHGGLRVSEHGSDLLLESTWDDPDITGAVVRINWKDLQVYDPGTRRITYDWTKLDTEFDRAAERGKLILLEVMAGDGLPRWIFTDFGDRIVAAPPGAKQVIPVGLKDHGSGGSGAGWKRDNASPADPHYRVLLDQMIADVIEHLRADSRHFQALGSFKVTGANFMTGEMRLQNNCTDDGSCPKCWCNTQIWQYPLGMPLPEDYQDPTTGQRIYNRASPTYGSGDTFGGGYTEAGLYDFVDQVEYRIWKSTQGQKSLVFMLIQAGFPRVATPGNYWRDSTQEGGPVNAAGDYSGTVQTKTLLRRGRDGQFMAVGGGSADPSAGTLFVPQHAGLQLLPQDRGVLPSCGSSVGATAPACSQETVPVVPPDGNGKREAPLPTAPPDTGPGCPNRWTIDESNQGQIIGFQTNNPKKICTPDHLDSTLWNGTANSKMVFWEAYEEVLWTAAVGKGTGPGAAPLSRRTHFSSRGPKYRKNLHQWGDELHRRRRSLVVPGDPNLADPFPDVHSVVFDEDLAPGEVRRYHFIHPVQCKTAKGAKWGTIVVTGT